MDDVMRTLAEAMFPFVEKGTSLGEGLRVFKYAAAKLHNCGDIEREIIALRCSAILASMLGSSREALDYLRDAHAIVCRSGPPILEASVLINLGETMSSLGSLAEADSHLNQALAIIRDAGDQVGEEYCLRMLSPIQWARGDPSAAIWSAQQAVGLSHAAGQREASGFQHLLLAGYRRQLRQYQEALEHLALAADAWEIIGDHTGEILMLVELGAIRSALGEHEDALTVLRDALGRARHGHILGTEFEVTLGLSEAYRSAGELDTALRHHWVALGIAEDLDQPRAIIRARDSVAQTLHAMGDLDQAIAQWQRVLDDHGATEIIELDDVRARLTRASQPATCPAPAHPARDRVPEPPRVDSKP
jgi:tetratricopeptide (TPR) repeat protein